VPSTVLTTDRHPHPELEEALPPARGESPPAVGGGEVAHRTVGVARDGGYEDPPHEWDVVARADHVAHPVPLTRGAESVL